MAGDYMYIYMYIHTYIYIYQRSLRSTETAARCSNSSPHGSSAPALSRGSSRTRKSGKPRKAKGSGNGTEYLKSGLPLRNLI